MTPANGRNRAQEHRRRHGSAGPIPGTGLRWIWSRAACGRALLCHPARC